MKKIFFLLLVAMAAPAYAGDLWEISSTSVGPDGTPQTLKEKKCLPKDSMSPSQILDDMGNCTFDQKSGTASAMTFSMTCKIPGMPAGLDSMKISGDASLNGNNFNMRYTITVGGNQAAPGGNFKMTGSAEAYKVGQCNER